MAGLVSGVHVLPAGLRGIRGSTPASPRRIQLVAQLLPGRSKRRTPHGANPFECLIFSEENAQHPQSTRLPRGKMNRKIGTRRDCFPDLELLRRENSGGELLRADKYARPKPWTFDS
jgi:hypothetical protein